MIEVLIADDDPNTRYLLEVFCRNRKDLHLDFVSNGQKALERVRAHAVDVLVADIRMPLMSGDELLVAVKEQFPEVPVVIMTSYGSIEDAVDFLQRGADDYLAKPLTRDVFLHRLDRIVERVRLAQEVKKLRESVGRNARLIGKSPQMREVEQRLPTIAQTEASVVVYGDSGTGKEVIARAIHTLSRRAERPFVTVNCGSLPEQLLESELFGYKKGAFTGATTDTVGLVEEAHTGTLFLDEIGEISLAVQVKLLRFLQLKEYKPLGSPKSKIADVRIVAATNRDLKQAVAEGSFREDLYYRLNIIPIELPPLRERDGDVALLATHFLQRFNQRFERHVAIRDPEVYRQLETHPWPGNVRELENKIEQLAVMAVDDVIRPEDVRLGGAPSAPSRAGVLAWGHDGAPGLFRDEKRDLLARFERAYLDRLLRAEGGHVSRAAQRAGLDRKNLWQLMRRHDIDAETYRLRATEALEGGPSPRLTGG